MIDILGSTSFGGFGSVKGLSDIYYRGLQKIHIEPFDTTFMKNIAANGLNLTLTGKFGSQYYTLNSLGKIVIGNEVGQETIYINTNGGKRDINSVVQSIFHEVLHESKVLDRESLNSAKLIMNLIKSGELFANLDYKKIEVGVLTALAEHAQIGALVDAISSELGLGKYKNSKFLTGAVEYYLTTGIAYGIDGGSKQSSDQIAAAKLGFETVGVELSAIYHPDGLVLPISANEVGSIQKYINEQGNVVSVIGSGSFNQLKYYATERSDSGGQVTANYTLGASLRILADALGFDGGKLGIDGSFAKQSEGSKNKPESRDANTNDSNHKTLGQSIKDLLGIKPIILDLDGDGIEITEISKSTQFIDAGGNGLKHRTAAAGAGDGVLFIDADNDGTISQKREYVFTEWDPTAQTDMQALRARFDSNGDGKLTAADTDFAKFKVMVTGADGSTSVQTLAALGITEINLTEDSTQITLADGSAVQGQSTFVMNGVTRTVASTLLMAEA